MNDIPEQSAGRELRIHIEGATADSVRPSSVPLRHLFELLTSFEQAILSVSDLGDAERAAAAECFSLLAIEPGSARPVLRFPMSLEDAADRVLEAVRTSDFSRVPQDTNRAMHRAFTLARDHGWTLHVGRDWRADAGEVELSESAPVPEPPRLDLRPSTMSGHTVLFGKLISVGGEKVIRAAIRPLDGSAQVPATCSLELALELGRYLFQTVGLAGTATWEAETLQIVDFEAQSLTPFRSTAPGEAFKRVRAAAAGAFTDEAIEELRRLRGGR